MDITLFNYAQFLVVFVNVALVKTEKIETKANVMNAYGSLLKNIIDVNEKRIANLKKLNDMQDFIVTKNSLAKIHGSGIENELDAEFRDQNDFLSLVDYTSDLKLRRTYTTYENTQSKNINIIIPFNSLKKIYINRNDDDKESHKTYKRMYDYGTLDNTVVENGKIHNTIDYNAKTYDNDDNSKIDDIIDGRYIILSLKDENENTVEEKSIMRRRNWRSCNEKKAAKVCRTACLSAHRNGCMRFKCTRHARMYFGMECRRSCDAKFITGKYSDSDEEDE